MIKYFVSYGVLFFTSISLGSGDRIRLLNWWDFLPNQTISSLRNDGYNIELSLYKSNGVAISRLVKDRADFDVAIVSSQIVSSLIKSNIIKKVHFSEVLKGRAYYEFIKLPPYGCLPYLWGATTFSVKGKVPVKDKFKLRNLVGLSRQGYKIGVVDDKIEVAYRLLLDSQANKCLTTDKNNFGRIHSTCDFSKYKIDELHPTNFITSTYDLLSQGPTTAAYGWHAEVGKALITDPHFKYALPFNKIVVGYDAACILNNPATGERLRKLKQFVEIITNRKNTEVGMISTQYFSAYKGHTTGLLPKVTSLLSYTIEETRKDNHVFLDLPSPSESKNIDNWWRAVRFGKK